MGIKDPARPEVAESIQSCTDAGIRVMMITGDAKDTAIAIARDVNIFPGEEEASGEPLKAFEGREFFHKPEHEQLEILKTGNIVFCRAEPSDKQKLIKMLQNLDEISAMTGDGRFCCTFVYIQENSFLSPHPIHFSLGVNDAPALQQSDIGKRCTMYSFTW